MSTLKSRSDGPHRGLKSIGGSTLSSREITVPRKPELNVAMSTAKKLGASAKDCVSQDNGVVPPEMRAAQLAEASRRENANQSGYNSEHEELCSD